METIQCLFNTWLVKVSDHQHDVYFRLPRFSIMWCQPRQLVYQISPTWESVHFNFSHLEKPFPIFLTWLNLQIVLQLYEEKSHSRWSQFQLIWHRSYKWNSSNLLHLNVAPFSSCPYRPHWNISSFISFSCLFSLSGSLGSLLNTCTYNI